MTSEIQLATQNLGITIPGQKWEYHPELTPKTNNNKTSLLSKISQLTDSAMPSEIIDAIALQFNVNPVAEVKIEKQGRMLGYLTFVFTNGQQLKNQSIIETYADMTGMLLDRLNQDIETNREYSKFKQITSQITDIVWRTDLQFNNTYISPSVERILGYSVEEYMILPIEKRYPRKTLEMFQQIFLEELEKENQPNSEDLRTQTIEIEHFKADSSIIPIEIHVSFVRDKNGKPVGLQGVSRDITKRKALEEDIKYQNKFRKLLIEIASDFINMSLENVNTSIQNALKELGEFVNADRSYTFDYDWAKDVCNNTYEWCADGITPEIENLQNLPLNMMMEWVETHKKGNPFFVSNVSKLPSGSAKETLENQNIKSFVTVPMMNENQCVGFVGFDSVIDYHEYTHTEVQLLHVFAQVLANVKMRKEMIHHLVVEMQKTEESEKKLKESQTMAKLGGWEFDVSKGVFKFNDNFYALFHTNIDEIGSYEMTPDEYASRFLIAEDYQLVSEEMEKALTTINPDFSNYLEHRILYFDGGTGYLGVKYFILKDKNGNTVKTYGVNQDITEKKLLELDLITAKEKAEESNRLKTAFINNISHEIRTPLNGILGFSGVMLDEGISLDEKMEFHHLLEQSTSRLLQTISDIIDISELNAGTIIPKTTDVHVSTLIKNQIEKIRKSCALKKIELIIQIPSKSENLIIKTDEDLIGKILFQILSNAEKFTTSGSIILGVEIIEQWVKFFIKDTGKGIAADKLDIIFGPFIQEDISNTRGHEGSGLGLALAKGMVKLLGGKIWVESQKGFGSAFFFQIPNTPEEMGANKNSVNVSEKNIALEKPFVLIAEDDDLNFIYMKALLTRINCIYVHARNGAEAVDLCKIHTEINLVLMDIKMPIMNGIEATKHIRNFRPELPIIATTAYAQIGDEQYFIEAGCTDYLAKPIKKDDLFLVLSKYLKF